MIRRTRRPLALLLALVLGSVLARADDTVSARGAAGALGEYVAKPDASYGWRELSSGRIGSSTYHELILTSQTWRGVPWKHQLIVLRPQRMDLGARALLFVHGGRWKEHYEQGWKGPKIPREMHIFARLAASLGSPLAVLRQVPHQPLFERTEDALIAYTFHHYLESGESDWPLLMPMVKSAVRGMDAMQQFARERWGLQIEGFTVAGASKRGWTSWLTAAVDPRVQSFAPMVIDMLNLPAQIELQRATFGGLSEQVADYERIDLAGRIDSERGQRLLSIVDPYRYRESFTQPKLIVLGTNDQYWPLDALKLYWGGLPGPKSVLYVPNQGHGIRDLGRLIGALSALHRHSARGRPLPELSWHFDATSAALALTVRPGRAARAVRVWSAHSPTRDFRAARWSSQPCRRSRDGGYSCRTPRRAGSFTASYAEVSFRERGEPAFSLSTPVCIAGAGEAAVPDCS